jgi:hypothetical protein
VNGRALRRRHYARGICPCQYRYPLRRSLLHIESAIGNLVAGLALLDRLPSAARDLVFEPQSHGQAQFDDMSSVSLASEGTAIRLPGTCLIEASRQVKRRARVRSGWGRDHEANCDVFRGQRGTRQQPAQHDQNRAESMDSHSSLRWPYHSPADEHDR